MSVSFYAVDMPEKIELGISLNWSNSNARAVLSVLGLPGYDEDTLAGEATIAECRRAVIRANATESLDAYTRPDAVEYAPPREHERGVVELKPVRMVSFGLCEEGIRERVDAFAAFVEAAVSAGALVISWG